MTDGEITAYLGQLDDMLDAGAQSREQSSIQSLRKHQRDILGLGPPPVFPHRRNDN